MAKVRGKGSVYKMERDKPRAKCRTWQLRATVESDSDPDKTFSMTKVVHGTYSEAQDAKEEFVDAIKRGDIRRSAGMRFREYSKAWLEERREIVAYNTYLKYCDHIKCANLSLSKLPIEDIRPRTLEGAYRSLRAGKSPSGKQLSGTYVHDIHVTLHRMFRDAVKDEHIVTNPAEFADPPAIDTKKRKPMPLDGIVSLVESLDPREAGPFVIRSSLHSGMRRGEIVALDVGDVDFEGHEVPVYHGVDKLGRLKDPKTVAGKRMIPMPPSLERDFRERIDAIEEMFADTREATGMSFPVVGPDTPLFCNSVGERMKPKIATRWWLRNRGRLGYEGYTLHDMRHSFLSAMARKKVDPRILQDLAGHAHYSTTMDIYVHVDDEDKQQAMEVMNW